MDRPCATKPAACAVLAALALGGGLSGCGHTLRVGPQRLLRVVLTEYRMNPGRAQVSAGPVTIVVRNLGRLNHNFAVLHNEQIQAETKPLSTGQRTELIIYLTPGTYVMGSTLFSDRALGLYGTLIVSP
jgi:predicted component of type VI protein secretion system